MNLDQRAGRAADGLKSSISGHPLLMMTSSPGPLPLFPKVLSFAGAFGLVIIVGLTVFQTNMFASDEAETAETTPTTVASTSTTEPATVTTVAAIPSVPPEGGEPGPIEQSGEIPPVAPPDTVPPELVVTSPADGEHLKDTAVAFAGRTEPGAIVMAGPYEATVSEDGEWSIVLILGAGGNKASFSATDAAGNTSEAAIVVFYDPPETTTTTKPEAPPSEWVFTAYATYGECAEIPPYDEYSGTAAPGTTILVLSDYGSGSTVANAEGAYWVRVEFPTAPAGKAFVVKVKNETTYEKYTFEFVSVAK
ncbi:MAG: hypothetical protein P1T08_00720 [Acidimicrobiia bacterium]|nr:hypothetical protein [Acidimicrobiia bacterium]